MNGITNWKTTVLGIAAGALNVFANYTQTGKFDWRTLVMSAALAGLGWFAKDNNVTGGTTPNSGSLK